MQQQWPTQNKSPYISTHFTFLARNNPTFHHISSHFTNISPTFHQHFITFHQHFITFHPHFTHISPTFQTISSYIHISHLSRTVFSRTFSIVLPPSRDIPACSRPLSVCSITIPICSASFRCLLICSVICPFRVFHLFPSISLFRFVSFQFSILGSDRSESGSLLSIRLHFCSATIPFPLISVFYCLLIL